MTYIPHHEAPARFETPSLVSNAMRTVRNALSVWLRAATSITKTIASVPAAISRAFATAYADPFQLTHPATDPADRQNF